MTENDARAGPGDGGDRFRIIARADPESISDALQLIVDHFTTTLTGPETGALQIVLAEVLNNIAEHAYAGLPGGLARIDIWREPQGLHCRIGDQGHPLPERTLPRGDLPSLEVDQADLPEGGFGWHMIRALTTGLTYARIGDINRLEFRLPRRCN
jgi:serine/threonine-protein kinase RsbW